MKRFFVKCASLILTLTFLTTQVSFGEVYLGRFADKLSASLATDDIRPDRSRSVRQDFVDGQAPGAIGNGQILMDLVGGTFFPDKVELSRERYEDLSGKIREAIGTAITLRVNNSVEVDRRLTEEDVGLVEETIDSLISLNNSLSTELYPINADIRGIENYLIGFPLDAFGREEKVAPAVDFIDWLYSRYPPERANLRLAQYIFHERTPEKTLIINGLIDRSDHRKMYNTLQSSIFGEDEVRALGQDLRAFINYKLGIPAPVVKSGDRAMVSIHAPPTAVDLTQLPDAFGENFRRYGLEPESLNVVEVVDGRAIPLAKGENPLQRSMRSQMIVGTTMLQVLQASNYVGMADALEMSPDDFGKLADGAAVTVGRKALEFLAEKYDVTIVIAGNEGKTRDGAPAMPLGYVINPKAKGGTYLYIGDSIEVTNGVKAGTAGASSMMALFPVTVPFETDGYKLSLWTDFHNLEELIPVVLENNSNGLESMFRQLAEIRGVSLAQLTEQYDILTLDRRKNDELIEQAQKLGFTVTLKKDGDPVPGILRAIYGIPDENGKKLIVLSTGGANEHRMAQIIATLYGRSLMTTGYVSTASLKAEDKKAHGSLRSGSNWTEKDLNEFAEVNRITAQVNKETGLNIPFLPQTPEELNGQIESEKTLAEQLRGMAAVGISSITGAPVVDAGILNSYLKPVVYYASSDGRERARVSGFLVNEQGRLFMYESVLRSDNMAETRAAMIADNDYGVTPEIMIALSQGSPAIQTETGQKYSIVQNMAAQNLSDFFNNIKDAVRITEDSVEITDRDRFTGETVDYLAREAALSQDSDVKSAAQRVLREAALSFNLKLGSIHDFYTAKITDKWSNITVPAVNGRADVYHQYQQLFRVATEKNVGVLVLELARSEMRYAAQDAAEFNAVSIAAAIKQGYEGMVFSQGDHYQVNREKYDKGGEEREKELKAIEALIRKAMLEGMYNIDLDPSTLVDESALKKILKFETEFVNRYLENHPELVSDLDENGIKSVRRRLVDEIEMGKIEFLNPEEKKHIEGLYKEMHKTTTEVTMRFIRYIRKLERDLKFPENFHVSVGIEERHIDKPEHKKNPSTVLGSATLTQAVLSATKSEGLIGPSKLSLQTGTMHGVGGEVDFGIYQRHLEFRERIGVAVFVQHGASTLEKHDFDKMRQGDVGEVHLATEYQKIELDIVSRMLPQLGEEMAKHLTGMMDRDAKMSKKFRAMWELAFGNMDLAASAIKPDDPEKDKKISLYSKLAEGQSNKERSVIINEILGDTMPKGLKGKLKDLVKELPGPFKRQLSDLPVEVRAAVDKALYEEFSTIFDKLGVANTKYIAERIVPFSRQPVIMPARPNAFQEAVKEAAKGRKLTPDELKNAISKDLPVRARIFKANLMRKLAEHPNEVFFFGMDTDIGKDRLQKAQMMPIHTAIREIEELKDGNGEKLFPNLRTAVADGVTLVAKVNDMMAEGILKELSNVFIVAQKGNVDNRVFSKIEGSDNAWITAIDDSGEGVYLPVFEAAALTIMAALGADSDAVRDWYNTIAEEPITTDALLAMLTNRIIYLLPKATKFDLRNLRELYELAAQLHGSA